MISRWDAAVNYMAQTEHACLPVRICFRCERCLCPEFYLYDQTEHIDPDDPLLVVRVFSLKCVQCGFRETDIVHTLMLGGDAACS